MLFVGDDWAEDHHDVEIVDDTGQVKVRRRLPEGVDGITRLHALIAEQMPAEWADLEPAQAASMVKVVLARYTRNRRLGDALQRWPSAPCADHPEPRPTTNSSAREPSATKQHCANSPTTSSASSTAASRPAPATTRTPPGAHHTTAAA
jgi:hypothetical protein